MSKSDLPPAGPAHVAANEQIHIRGARQNNLKNIDLDINIGDFTVVTGLSGSGKSSLVFDTLYAEGQRRYVETFSPYARQFLDRMDRPHVDRIDGVPPAIAIDQSGVVRTSRSTVGTMTELNDYLKLLFARHATLFCPQCGRPVREHTPQSIFVDVALRLNEANLPPDTAVYVTFESLVPASLPLQAAVDALSAQGFTKILQQTVQKDGATLLTVVADRFRYANVARERAVEAFEQANDKGRGALSVLIKGAGGEFTTLARYRTGFVCADCNRVFSAPSPSVFSFNSPLGACETCRGFGRIVTVDPALVIPDPSKSLLEGAIKPWTTNAYKECQSELFEHARARGIDLDTPYEDLSEADRAWIWDGQSDWRGQWRHQWYGIRRFFDWLETKAYKMHVRVMLSRYRSYVTCPDCNGSHLKPEALNWRFGSAQERRALRESTPVSIDFAPVNSRLTREQYQSLPGLNFHEMALLPIHALHTFFKAQNTDRDASLKMIVDDIVSRLGFLCDVGLGYLTLNRQSRTLSGGEVQRVNLTTALGTSLVNTLFVLDEPSIGLHPRDMDRVNAVMRRLTAAGNTLVVVEHDPQVMLAANRLIDMGPGAGSQGGEIVFDGPTRAVLNADTLTAQYLSGRKRIARAHPAAVTETSPSLMVHGAREHNLKHIDVNIPLKAFVAVAGVSGSGKSTLISDILVPALERRLGKGTPVPGAFDGLSGTLPKDIIFVDQSPIGRTTRANPVSYVRSFDGIRRLFAASNAAQIAGLGVADFSFNAGKGRCPTCGGSGTEHIEMQFLSDVYLPCPDCNGTRYRAQTLDVKIPLSDGKFYNIADVLQLTVNEACNLFAEHRDITAGLGHLRAVGLGYLTLGQPLTTLSGGERQRLKLAGHLAQGLNGAGKGSGKLFVFDEPTTGLHFNDINTLIDIFDKLVAMGHSVVVIEHNLDVLNTADWLIELGPEGGENGGTVVFTGTPDALVAGADTPTARALSAWRDTLEHKSNAESFFNLPPLNKPAQRDETLRSLSVKGAREHNLKNLDVKIPRNCFNVITGPSGSGKSTLAFDIIFAEGQRRYLESLNAYARSMVQPAPKPDVDAVLGIPPAVAIEQRTSRGGLRSTVATMTELHHFLRLLFVKLGTQYCPDCLVPTAPQSRDAIIKGIKDTFKDTPVQILAPIVRHQKGSFRAELEQLTKNGFQFARIDGGYASLNDRTVRLERYQEHNIELPIGTCVPSESPDELRFLVDTALMHGHGRLMVSTHIITADNVARRGENINKYRTAAEETLYSTLSACPECLKSFPALDPRLFSYNSSMGACSTCSGYGILSAAVKKAQKKDEAFDKELDRDDKDVMSCCPDCHGARLNRTALAVRWQDQNIGDIGAMTIDQAAAFFSQISLSAREKAIGSDAVAEIVSRLHFLQTIGLGYLTLNRSAPTLSGGEAQRIRLASQLGSNLRGVCYVLDEPTIGLHPRDNDVLLDAIDSLTRKGNTLLVVEHDEDTIRRADHIIDIGPGAGINGGRLIAQGSYEDIVASQDSVTGRYLRHPLTHTGRPLVPFDPQTDPKITLINARKHNLQIPSLDIALGRLTVVTGVSGSGKSTLMRDIVYNNVARQISSKYTAEYSDCDRIDGIEPIERVLEVDQTPIGKTPRSCPATYVGFFNDIRELFACTNESKARGYDAGRYSFNVKGGRCEECGGQGYKTVEMAFLPDVKVTCEICHGARFNQETLDVKWKGKSIGEVLKMQVSEAADFFASMPKIAHPLNLLKDVGLGYLTLGQPSPTLSGGEAQRIKLVKELAKVRELPAGKIARKGGTLYILDEPTVGLHMSDVDKLIQVLKRLVGAGHTVVVIEHNLDVMAEADRIIDMGPEGGSRGGRVVGADTPYNVAQLKTHTGHALKAFLKAHRPKKASKATNP